MNAFVLQESISQRRTLIIYKNITRPNQQFSWSGGETFKWDLDFLIMWINLRIKFSNQKFPKDDNVEHVFIIRVVFSKRKNGITLIWDDGIEVFHIVQ